MSIFQGTVRHSRRGLLALALALLLSTALPALSDHLAGTSLVTPAAACGDHCPGTGGG